MSRTRLVGVSIGDVRIAIEAPPALPWRFAEEPAAAFAASAAEADLHLGVQVGRVERRRPRLGAGAASERLEVRSVPAGWQVLHRRHGRVEHELRCDAELRAGVLIVDRTSPAARQGGYPLPARMERWIVRHRLARSGGLLLPACAVVRRGRATLFAGPPGTGKVALSRALAGIPGVDLLADRLVALRASGTGFRVHATPWSRPGTERSAPLEAVHLIHAGPAPSLASLEESEAVASLLGITSPLDEPGARDGILGVIERLAGRVPVSRATWATPQDLAELAWGPNGERWAA